MDPDRLSRIEELFSAALDQPSSERAAFLERACSDPDLRREVLALLAVDQDAGRYFTDLADRLAGDLTIEAESASHRERRIGPYRTLRIIGHGGMGAVFLAERADGQFQQQVALKLIRLGMDSDAALRRFLKERQIVARLQHPHIATLLDGGVTDDGRPYFAMEYVSGRPITVYCTEQALPIDHRLRLFLDVGDAVQWAHRNLVVHRDVKPTNILVTDDGQVKLLDFGIAKLLSEDTDGGAGPATRTGERVLTPIYAAPEQIRGEPVTTATDVYGLGVVLYELLTGRRPHEPDGCPPLELERAILEDEPAKPSAAVADRTLARRLRGDLDTICLMALRKQPDRRYRSAEQLTEDVRRHLAGLPVVAREDTVVYRTAKFVRRHRFGVASAALFALVTTGFAALMTVESARTARERDKAERVAAILVDLFEVADPSEARGNAITAREVLDRAAGRIDRDLAREPDLQAALFDVLGRVYQNLGLYARASPLIERALDLRRQTAGRPHREVASGLNTLGELLRLRGEYGAAQQTLREALAMNEALEDGRGPGTVRSLNNLGKVLQASGAQVEAEALLRRAIALGRAQFGEKHLEVAESLNNLAAVLYARGDFTGAEPLFREALAIRRGLAGDDHPSVPATLNNLASLLGQKGDYDAAERAQREALDIYRRVLGAEHPRVATTLNNLGLLLYAKLDYAGAEPLFRESLAMRRRLLGAAHPDIAQTLGNLGLLLQARGALDEAEDMMREALAIRRKAFGERHALVAGAQNNLALLLQSRGRFTEAEPLFRESQAMLRALVGEAHPLVAMSVHNLAALLHQKGDLGAAERLYRDALVRRRGLLPPRHPDLAHTLVGLGRLLTTRGEVVEAEALVREGLEIRRAALPAGSPAIAEAEEALASLEPSRQKPR